MIIKCYLVCIQSICKYTHFFHISVISFNYLAKKTKFFVPLPTNLSNSV